MNKVILALGALAILSGCVEPVDPSAGPNSKYSYEYCKKIGGKKIVYDFKFPARDFVCFGADDKEIERWSVSKFRLEANATEIK